MVVDFEHHYIPVKLGRQLGMKMDNKLPVRQGDAAVHAQLFDIEGQLRDMDRAGVDVAVSCILGWDTTLENCRLINDCTSEMQKEYPSRFAGLAHVPPLEGAPALDELKRATDDLGLKGVTISSQVAGLPLDAKEFEPFFQAVEELGLPIFIHPALAPKGYDLLKDYMLPVILTREFDFGVAVTRLIAGGILERHSTLKIVVSHFGGGMTGYKSALRVRLIASSCRSRSMCILRCSILTWPASKAALSHCAARWKGLSPSGWFLPPITRRTSTAAIRKPVKASTASANISKRFRICRSIKASRAICWVAPPRVF